MIDTTAKCLFISSGEKPFSFSLGLGRSSGLRTFRSLGSKGRICLLRDLTTLNSLSSFGQCCGISGCLDRKRVAIFECLTQTSHPPPPTLDGVVFAPSRCCLSTGYLKYLRRVRVWVYSEVRSRRNWWSRDYPTPHATVRPTPNPRVRQMWHHEHRSRLWEAPDCEPETCKASCLRGASTLRSQLHHPQIPGKRRHLVQQAAIRMISQLHRLLLLWRIPIIEHIHTLHTLSKQTPSTSAQVSQGHPCPNCDRSCFRKIRSGVRRYGVP